MRKLSILTVLAIVFAVSANATVWRVNNTPNVDADFSSLSTAVNDASVLPFDTLYVEGSNSSYGTIYVNKPLIIIGSGYFLEENDSTQANRLSSIIKSIHFENGSSGCILSGCMFNENLSHCIRIETNNITVSRNYIHSTFSYWFLRLIIFIGSNNLNDIVIENNYIDGYNLYGDISAIYSEHSNLNLVIQNNYIMGISDQSTGYAIYLSGSSTSPIIRNNVLNGNLTSNDGIYLNNILIEGEISGTNNFFNNNISDTTQFGSDFGNQANVDMTTVFIDHLSEVDNGLILKAGSPAIGAGSNGVDCGMFGGNRPYILSGMPAIPAIFAIEQTGIGNSSQPIEVNLKAKSHR